MESVAIMPVFEVEKDTGPLPLKAPCYHRHRPPTARIVRGTDVRAGSTPTSPVLHGMKSDSAGCTCVTFCSQWTEREGGWFGGGVEGSSDHVLRENTFYPSGYTMLLLLPQHKARFTSWLLHAVLLLLRRFWEAD